MQYIAFILNIPWTVLGVVLAIVSIPHRMSLISRPLAIIIRVKSFWWYSWLPGMKRMRGMANGHVILLGPLEEEGDLAHELIHTKQAIREPLIHPFLYQLETLKVGYRKNKYEVEAYSKAGNVYRGKEG